MEIDMTASPKTRARSSKHIIAEINCPHLSLHKGHDHWYFVYDNVQGGVFETLSVYVLRLSDLSLDGWLSDGRAFIAKIDAKMKRGA